MLVQGRQVFNEHTKEQRSFKVFQQKQNAGKMPHEFHLFFTGSINQRDLALQKGVPLAGGIEPLNEAALK